MSRRLPALVALALAVTACRTAPKGPWHVEAKSDDTRRSTSHGDVVGGPGRGGSHAWLGIPFAAPPVGELRWRAPRPPAPWSEVLAATHHRSGCPQFVTQLGGADEPDEHGIAGTEDCLYLNLWAPPFARAEVPQGDARLPVMLWIHGGGNSIGSAAPYDGGPLAAAQKVVVVTVQYRLGPFGWLRHAALREGAEPAEASGNFGTLDLVRALEWVRDNAAAFGGDPGNVTVFGESAGGVNTYSLLVAPQAKGLFHRAIAQSAYTPKVSPALAEHFSDDAEPGHRNSASEVLARLLVSSGRAADRAAARALIGTTPPAALAAFLRARTAQEVLLAYRQGQRASHLGLLDMPFLIGDGAVLPEGDWLERFAQPDGWNRVPVITGSTREEAKLFLFFDPEMTWKLFWVLPRVRDEARYAATAETLSRMWRAVGVDAVLAAMARSGATGLYSYRFDWDDEPSVWGTDLHTMLGAAHAMDVPFVFGAVDLGRMSSLVFSEGDAAARKALSDAMGAYWAELARTGRPGRGGTATLPEWQPYDVASEEGPKAMLLDVAAGGGPRMAFAVEQKEKILADLEADARVPEREQKCALYRRLAALRQISKDEYAKACPGLPLEPEGAR